MSNGNFLKRGLVLELQPSATPQDQQNLADRMARLVGFVAFGLPVILFIGGLMPESCFRDSISHFYYAPFLGSVFVGLLFFIGGFLLAYSGETWMESKGSTIAGLGAFGVALFPTTKSGCDEALTSHSRVFALVDTSTNPVGISESGTYGQTFFQMFGATSEYHLAGAGIVFVYLGIFCIVVLRRVIDGRHIKGGVILKTKINRNRLYLACGITILGCVALLAFKKPLVGGDLTWWDGLNLTSWVEAVALWAFGLAWVIKGRVITALND